MAGFTLDWIITGDESGLSVKEFLKQKEISKAALTDIKFKGGLLLLNQEEVTVRRTLTIGDHLQVMFPEERSSEGMAAEEPSLAIIYEDPYLLVVNKTAGMSTIPSREHPTGSLANGLIGYYQQQQLQATAHIVTRLDRDTCGLVLIAKHRHVHHLFSKGQKQGAVRRVYEAFASGVMSEDKGMVEAPIGRHPNSIIERTVTNEGQYACTHFLVKKRYPSFTHLELKLETGRTHQIRVHMAHLGHPLLGDDLYGGTREQMGRQALHCREVSFDHPFTFETLTFRANLPDDMQKLVQERG